MIFSNNLHIIRQLQPKIYQKTTEMYPADYTGDISGPYTIELGLIAQEILDISDLKFCVGGGDYIDSSGNLVEEKYSVNYNNIFTAHIAATKELDEIVQSQAQTIQDLSQNLQEKIEEINVMKIALNRLLSDASYDLI